MTAVGRQKTNPNLISSSRPKHARVPSKLSSRQTRGIIRSHHNWSKQLKQAEVAKDEERRKRILADIEAAGGIEVYQQASLQGQLPARGGDSSRVLLEWLLESTSPLLNLRVLEVGALQIDNAVTRCPNLEIERIDLHSQHPLIRKQDFMKRPAPSSISVDTEGFDIVSLSLVLNFVDDATGRGDMLRRTTQFLRSPQTVTGCHGRLLPCLFLVLPAPTVSNSRYLDESTLEQIMSSLGFSKVRSKWSPRLVYYLWKYDGSQQGLGKSFRKKEVRAGKSRNNFAIVLS